MTHWLVYLLRCADDSLYCGITTDIKKRLDAHNTGKASKYTRSRLPVEIVFQEPAESESAAKVREAQIKKFSKSEKESLISCS